MNSAILAFKRYKETFLIYTGLNKHENEQVGLWDTKITVEEMRRVKNIYYMENHTRFYYRFTKG